MKPKLNLLRDVNELAKKTEEFHEEMKRLESECPYTNNPKPMGNGRCEWCGEDHWTGHG